jgi:hypothetical protein
LTPTARLVRRGALVLSSVLICSGVVATPALSQTVMTTTPHSITTIAGDGTRGSAGDGGLAVNAQLDDPTGLALDVAGTLYIADGRSNKVRRVVNPITIQQDTISTFAGDGSKGFSGDGGFASAAELDTPSGVAADHLGDVFIADTGNNRVREVLPDGHIRTVAGNGSCHTKPISDDREQARRVSQGNGGPAPQASLCDPTGLAVHGDNLYVADTGHNEVRVIDAAGVINAFAGDGRPGYSGDGGQATGARLDFPTGLAVNAIGDVFIADTANDVVREVLPSGTIRTFAGQGKSKDKDKGARVKDETLRAGRDRLRAPTGLAVDQLGDLFIADTGNNRLRQVDSSGTVSTFAGTGRRGFSGDGGLATNATLAFPTGTVAVDSTTVLFSDTGNQRVRGVFNGPPPVLPESMWAILFPLGAVALVGFGVLRFRRRGKLPARLG